MLLCFYLIPPLFTSPSPPRSAAWWAVFFQQGHTRPAEDIASAAASPLHPSLFAVDMVDTQQLLAWPVGFSLNSMDLPELYDHPHSLDLKHLTTLDYTSISSSSTQSSMSPSLVACISPTNMAYDPSPSLSEEHLTNMDYLNMHGCSKSSRVFCTLRWCTHKWV